MEWEADAFGCVFECKRNYFVWFIRWVLFWNLRISSILNVYACGLFYSNKSIYFQCEHSFVKIYLTSFNFDKAYCLKSERVCVPVPICMCLSVYFFCDSKIFFCFLLFEFLKWFEKEKRRKYKINNIIKEWKKYQILFCDCQKKNVENISQIPWKRHIWLRKRSDKAEHSWFLMIDKRI